MTRVFITSAALAVALFACGTSARAQDAPKGEVFAGYSYSSYDDSGIDRIDGQGWHLAATGNVNRWFGIEGDASGHYQDGRSVHYLQGGARFTYRGERASPYAHALMGATFVDAIGNGTDWVFTVGGGVDVKVNDRVSIRAVQVDYTPTLLLDGLRHNARVSTGVVFTF
jgi:opacity protein-like surface antigen